MSKGKNSQLDEASLEMRATLASLLKEHLSIEVKSGHWTDPNRRTIVVKFDGEPICEDSFDVTKKPEYEG